MDVPRYLLPASFAALVVFSTALAAPDASVVEWHPVRVSRDAEGWPHFFEKWDAARKAYVPTVLCGYGNLAFLFPLDDTFAVLDDLAENHGNFTRLWMRAGDGYSAYYFNPEKGKVDLDRWNEDFFARLDTILDYAGKLGVVVEVMLWDRCTSWVGGGLSTPISWQKGIGHERGQNPFHPDNHYRGSAPHAPLPGVVMRDTQRIEADAFYDTGNETWMKCQERYMRRVMDVLRQHDNVTVELINEAPPSQAATEWRKYMHQWLKSAYPGLLVQSNSLGADSALAQWGAENPGVVDMTASHDYWSYDSAQAFYGRYKGVLPGCNEYIQRDLSEMSRCRRMMWGLTMAGGASWNENITAPNGPALTQEIHRFFNPAVDVPIIGKLRPAQERIRDNDGSMYVLGTDDESEILIYVSESFEMASFEISVPRACRYRWFTCAGEDSVWNDWQVSESAVFTPPSLPCGLQVRPLPEDSYTARHSLQNTPSR